MWAGLQDSHSFYIRDYIPVSSENGYLSRSNGSKKRQTENIAISIKPPECLWGSCPDPDHL